MSRTVFAYVDESTADPRHNGAKIEALYAGERGSADLYRTITAGPSGQRTALHVGRIRPDVAGTADFVIIDVRNADTAGTARWDVDRGAWSITAVRYDGSREWIGYADSVALGCDVLINGAHAATGRHDSRRITPGKWLSADTVRAENARTHTAECAPCRAAGESRGYMHCVRR